ncbi:endocuticle structural glycoprotein SgAbd-2-like [Hyalella azteca]|uniref:Endocuticle structural glycoprotein SgAbd-2-like n=1 Tax=Hyalella azteca TaxID=294128 RepID=A0A8B7P537_HYAAZ|nr:endocuticle structural glycoprotein SgAbd-2-like [Hyalella azteca]
MKLPMQSWSFALLVLPCLCLSRPQEKNSAQTVQVIQHESFPPEGPNFSLVLETSNGIRETKEGSEGPEGTSVIKGSYSFLMEDGSIVMLHYTADENGFVAESPILPSSPPLPLHAQQQIASAENERLQEALQLRQQPPEFQPLPQFDQSTFQEQPPTQFQQFQQFDQPQFRRQESPQLQQLQQFQQSPQVQLPLQRPQLRNWQQPFFTTGNR